MLACGMNVALRWLAGLTCAGMWLVLVMGAAVTNTGSAEGCGRSWPLCNGQFVPEFTVSTAIEYSHRAVTGVEGLLVVALTAAMLGLWRHDPQAVVLALLMLGTLLLQAGLGAGAETGR
jgi:cytochrome c oxidase assembly protein subunit 15